VNSYQTICRQIDAQSLQSVNFVFNWLCVNPHTKMNISLPFRQRIGSLTWMMKFNAFGTPLKMLAKKNTVSTGTTKNMLVKTLGFLEFSLKPRDFVQPSQVVGWTNFDVWERPQHVECPFLAPGAPVVGAPPW
jgi:hypothetical protein